MTRVWCLLFIMIPHLCSHAVDDSRIPLNDSMCVWPVIFLRTYTYTNRIGIHRRTIERKQVRLIPGTIFRVTFTAYATGCNYQAYSPNGIQHNTAEYWTKSTAEESFHVSFTSYITGIIRNEKATWLHQVLVVNVYSTAVSVVTIVPVFSRYSALWNRLAHGNK